MPPIIDLDDLGLDNGGHLLLSRALATAPPGAALEVVGTHPDLAVHLAAWCRSHGHHLDRNTGRLMVHRGSTVDDRWSGAVRAGDAARPAAHADRRWGLAARGALIEAGGPPLSVDWVDRDLVWADVAPTLYANATANQWNPDTVVDWSTGVDIPGDIEDAVVQIMTYLVENEQAALVIPARLLSRMHPHFREVAQLLAAQVADEARHMEIFTRRGLLNRDTLGVSGAGGRASL